MRSLISKLMFKDKVNLIYMEKHNVGDEKQRNIKSNNKHNIKSEKRTDGEKGNTWIWATLVMGMIGLFMGAIILVWKYKKEFEKEKFAREEIKEPNLSDLGNWWE